MRCLHYFHSGLSGRLQPKIIAMLIMTPIYSFLDKLQYSVQHARADWLSAPRPRTVNLSPPVLCTPKPAEDILARKYPRQHFFPCGWGSPAPPIREVHFSPPLCLHTITAPLHRWADDWFILGCKVLYIGGGRWYLHGIFFKCMM